MKIGLISNRTAWGLVRVVVAISMALSWIVALPATPAAAAKSVSFFKAYSTGLVPTGVADQYSIIYMLDVTQDGSGNSTYSITDTPSFGNGITITSASYRLNGSLPPASLSTSGPWTFNGSVGGEDLYEITVNLTVTGSASATDKDCTINNGETNNTGTRNRITAYSSGDTITTFSDDVCDPVGATDSNVIVTTNMTFATLDSNKSCTEGPNAVYYSVEVWNPNGSAVGPLTLTVGNPSAAEANPGGFSGSVIRDAGESGVRDIASLGAGAAQTFFFLLDYPCYTATYGDAPDWTWYIPITIDDGSSSFTYDRYLTTRSELSTSTSTVVSTVFTPPPGSSVAKGDTVTMDVTYDLGNLSADLQDVQLQPVGLKSFDSNCWRLISTHVVAVGGSVAGISDSGGNDNQVYYRDVTSGGGFNNVEVGFTFEAMCNAGGSTNAQAWLDIGSGTQYKYKMGDGLTFPEVAAPDLTAVKTHSGTGSYTTGDTFTWTISVSNSGPDAIFDNSELILEDNLPDGVGYSNFIVSNMSGSATIGPPLCVFVPLFNDLDCTANGDTTFQDGQGFDVSFDVNTADFSGTLDNPSGGVCRVDPDGLIEESNENNNDCSDTVVVNTADTGTIIIIKNTVPDAEQSFDFTGTGPEGYDFGGGFSLKNNGTDPNSMTFSGLLPSGSFTNAYTITEADPSGLGYLLTGIECESSKNVDILIEKGTTPTIDLLAGETVTCTFTNTLQTTPGIDKKITATNQTFTDDSTLPTTGTPPVAIGEIVQYQVVLTLDAGEYATAQLVDTMDPGLSFLNCISITPDSAVTTDLAGGFDAACAAPSFDPTPPTPLDVQRVVTFDLGTVTVDEGGGTLTFEYNAIVLDSIDNQDGHTLHNSAQLNWDTDQTLGPAVTEVVVNEPQLEIKKEADTKFIAVGSVVTFTVTFQHVTGVSHTPAFDVVLTDPIPSEFDYVDGSLDCTTESTNAPDAPVADVVANVITAGWSEFDIGDVGVCTFQLKANDTLVSGQETENVAFVDWTSLPGDPGQQNDNIYSTERNFIQDDPINDYQARSDVPFEAPGGGGGGKGRGFQIPSAGFAPGVYTEVGAPPSTTPYANVGVNLRIPKLGLNMAVEGVPYVNGTWQVDWLTGIGGWLTGTAFPGLPGNSVIMSHVVTHYGSNGPFARLYALEPGDYIFVTSFGRQYIYTVRWTKNVAPDDISVLAHEDKPVLTLMTCSEYNDQTQTYDGRLVVHAELIAVQPLK